MLLVKIYCDLFEISYTRRKYNLSLEECKNEFSKEYQNKSFEQWSIPEFFYILNLDIDMLFDVEIIDIGVSKTVIKYFIPGDLIGDYHITKRLININDETRIMCEYYQLNIEKGIFYYYFHNLNKFNKNKLHINLSNFQVNGSIYRYYISSVLYDGNMPDNLLFEGHHSNDINYDDSLREIKFYDKYGKRL